MTGHIPARLIVWMFLIGAALSFPRHASAQLPDREPLREWTSAKGQTFEAAIVSFDGETILFRARNGRRTPLPLSRLSPEGQRYMAKWQKSQPLDIVMPDVVGVDSDTLKVEVIEEDERHEKFVYRTPHFEFESQGKFTTSLLREVARNFEATYELVKALPWGIDPEPLSGKYFRARLLRTRAAYEALGAPKNSGGVYMRSREMFLVPFMSIGLKAVGKSYAKDDDYETATLVHELTHQMMQSWLEFLPQWVIEGTAEYTGMLPLKHGHFRVSHAKGALKDHLDDLEKRPQGVPMPYPLEELFTMSNEKWSQTLDEDPDMASRLYFTSYLLVYYFMHMEGEGDPQLFVRYFRAVDAMRQKVKAYRKAVEKFKKLPGVEVRPDGSYRWPGNLQHPEEPPILASERTRNEWQQQTLEILLNGRSEAELMEQIRSAYARLGIRL